VDHSGLASFAPVTALKQLLDALDRALGSAMARVLRICAQSKGDLSIARSLPDRGKRRRRPSLAELLIREHCAARGPGWDATNPKL
jgi:hypothetical protein